MRNTFAILSGLLIILGTGAVQAGPKGGATQTALGVPVYPGWTVHRMDDRVDTSGKTHLYQYQYVSNDPAKAIVDFAGKAPAPRPSFERGLDVYDQHARRRDDQITAPPDGVPHADLRRDHDLDVADHDHSFQAR
jgi:hypothetical protein